MERDLVRLEILKICYKHGRHPNDSVIEAKILETYIVGDEESHPKPELKKASTKKSGNPIEALS